MRSISRAGSRQAAPMRRAQAPAVAAHTSGGIRATQGSTAPLASPIRYSMGAVRRSAGSLRGARAPSAATTDAPATSTPSPMQAHAASAAPSNPEAPTFQDAISRLQAYWASCGCAIYLPHNTEVGAGTMNPATFLRVQVRASVCVCVCVRACVCACVRADPPQAPGSPQTITRGVAFPPQSTPLQPVNSVNCVDT
jgi:hypothetical protein